MNLCAQCFLDNGNIMVAKQQHCLSFVEPEQEERRGLHTAGAEIVDALCTLFCAE